MDKRIRRNELCVVGLPRCDYVFSSTRTCFIGYGFHESGLEMEILRGILEREGIQAVEAGGSLAPAQNAFCAKICSKIITSQFCLILLNNDIRDAEEVPSANVSMEYGLMLGFNKYVVPFQKMEQTLSFNIAGLDTVKYSTQDFARKATEAVKQAIRETTQDAATPEIDQKVTLFILMKRHLVTPLETIGDRNIFQLGAPLGFNLINDFSGMAYRFLGNFTAVRPEIAVWRLRLLNEIVVNRFSTVEDRVKLGVIQPAEVSVIAILLKNMEFWLIVTSDVDKRAIESALAGVKLNFPHVVYSLDDVNRELSTLA